MKTVGIICEYNPFHLGHQKQIEWIKRRFPGDCAIICLMSGNYVQRGAPAVYDKTLRAKAAVLSGADLVLELPVTCALSSAEGFAAGGVRILGQFCDYLCFGSETGNAETLMSTARALLSEEFQPLLRDALSTGVSFPAARAQALEELGLDAEILRRPNDILAVEYCKAILSQQVPMKPLPLVRQGSYHDRTAHRENPSATALRQLIHSGEDWTPFVPESAAAIFATAVPHSLQAGQRAVLSKLRTMTEEEFEALPYGSEGLWRKFMHSCRREATLSAITAATKSKRYTATRIDRMMLCAFLGISRKILETHVPYTRILAFNDTGRALLKQIKQQIPCVNAGEIPEAPYWSMEKHWEDLYGLFCEASPEPPGREENRRVFYHRTNEGNV